VDLTEATLVFRDDPSLLRATPLDAGTPVFAAACSNLRPGQSLKLVVGWNAGDLASLTVKHVAIRLEKAGRASRETFFRQYPDCKHGDHEDKRVGAALTGRAAPFHDRKAEQKAPSPPAQSKDEEPSPIRQYKVLAALLIRKERPELIGLPNLLQLTFVVFVICPKAPKYIFIRGVENICAAQDLQALEPGAWFTGRLWQEWLRVGELKRHVLEVTVPVKPIKPKPVQVRFSVSGRQVQLFALGVSYWETKLAQVEGDVYHYLDKAEVDNFIADEDEEDELAPAEKEVEKACLDLKGVAPVTVKAERDAPPTSADAAGPRSDMLPALEESKAAPRPGPAPTCFVVPEQPVAPSLLEQSERPRRDEASKSPRRYDGHQHWRDRRPYRPRRGGKPDAPYARFPRSTPLLQPPLPPPPPPPLLTSASWAASVQPFSHSAWPVPPVFGEAAAHPRLRPLVELRIAMQTSGVASPGLEQAFTDCMESVVTYCLPYLTDPPRRERLETWLREMGVTHPPLHVLSCYGPEDVQTVFHDFKAVPVRIPGVLGQPPTCPPPSLSCMQRLVTWMHWLQALEVPPFELFDVCLRELPAAVLNSKVDSHGWPAPEIFRVSDLRRVPRDEGQKMVGAYLSTFVEGVKKYWSKYEGQFGEGQHFDRHWWVLPSLRACYWAVHFMDHPLGRVNFLVLEDLFETLLSFSFHYEVQELAALIGDKIGHRNLPQCVARFNSSQHRRLGMRAEYLAFVQADLPAWPCV